MLHCVEPLADAVGPGFSTVPLNERRAALLRARLCHPVHAAALAAVLITGIDPQWLRRVSILDLDSDAALLCVRYSGIGHECYAVPSAARPIFRAARAFLLYRRAERNQPLLSMGIGPNGTLVRDSAQQCAVSLPPLREPRPHLGWHHRAEYTPVADPIHRHAGIRSINRSGELPDPDENALARLSLATRPGIPSEPDQAYLSLAAHDDLLFGLGLPTRGARPRCELPGGELELRISVWRRILEAQARREQADVRAKAQQDLRALCHVPMFERQP